LSGNIGVVNLGGRTPSGRKKRVVVAHIFPKLSARLARNFQEVCTRVVSLVPEVYFYVPKNPLRYRLVT